VRVPAFRQDGVYTASIDGKDTQVVVATGDRAAIAAFLQSLKTELLREYRGGDGAIAEMLKLHAAEKNPPFAGAAIVLTGQQDKRSGKLYFLGKRNYVEINDRLTRRVTYTRGVKTTFDPPVQISYFLFEVSQWDDDEDKITADMTAGDLSFAVRSDALTAARPCMLFDHKEFMVLDKATPAADARP
jgi:hypothetical protein